MRAKPPMQSGWWHAHRFEYLLTLCLAGVTLVGFWPVRHCQFTNYDDPFYVTKNPHVREGLSPAAAWWALTTTSNSNWHPLTWLSLQLDHRLYGLNPAGYHLTNLLLHTANGLLLFWVLRRMTRAVAPSALVAALFALHPLHVESVAWITERKDVLSTLFWMLTLAAYVSYVERPGLWRYSCVVLAFALGLTAKPMLVTLPAVLLLLDYWPLGRSAILEKLPLLVLAGASCVITLIAQEEGGNLRALDEISLTSRAANTVVAYVTYLLQMFWPRRLAAFYPYVNLSWSDWRVQGAALLLAGITLAVVWQGRRRPFLLVGWLWYVGTLAPVIGLVQIGDHAHADRYTYVPLMGAFIMVAWAMDALAKQGQLGCRLALAGALAALIGCLLLTRTQVSYWQDSAALWTHTIAVTGPNAKAHYGLGAAYRDQGDLEAAAGEFRLALAIRPGYDLARLNLGWCLLLLDRIEEADAAFTAFLPADTAGADAHLQLGERASRTNQPDSALAHFTRVLRLRPHDAVAHLRLAQELITRKQYAAACRHLDEAERSDPQIRATSDFQAARRAVQESSAEPRTLSAW